MIIHVWILKKLTLHILHYCNKVTWDNANKFPSSLPGKEGTQFGPSWVEMMPWLNSFSLAKFAGKPKYIKATDIESVGYFIKTHMYPPPPLDDVRLKKE